MVAHDQPKLTTLPLELRLKILAYNFADAIKNDTICCHDDLSYKTCGHIRGRQTVPEGAHIQKMGLCIEYSISEAGGSYGFRLEGSVQSIQGGSKLGRD
jgi:hypothetical protein